MSPVTHLILMCGLPGSGKTTRALALAANLRAVRFCPDDCMKASVFHLDDELARDRLELMQWDQAQQLVEWNGLFQAPTEAELSLFDPLTAFDPKE